MDGGRTLTVAQYTTKLTAIFKALLIQWIHQFTSMSLTFKKIMGLLYWLLPPQTGYPCKSIVCKINKTSGHVLVIVTQTPSPTNSDARCELQQVVFTTSSWVNVTGFFMQLAELQSVSTLCLIRQTEIILDNSGFFLQNMIDLLKNSWSEQFVWSQTPQFNILVRGSTMGLIRRAWLYLVSLPLSSLHCVNLHSSLWQKRRQWNPPGCKRYHPSNSPKCQTNK